MRRYFVINAFDGVLTTLGVLAGGYSAASHGARRRQRHPHTAVGIGVAGFYGSYLVERAERDRAHARAGGVDALQPAGHDISSASTYATVVIAFVDGVSPLLAALLAMVPFFFTAVISVHTAYFVSGGIAFVELFLLGLFLGRVSRERLVCSGVKLVAAGVVALGLSWLLGIGCGERRREPSRRRQAAPAAPASTPAGGRRRRPARRPERAPARGRGAPRGSAAHPRRRRLGQDARAHPSRRLSHRGARRAARRDRSPSPSPTRPPAR